MGEESDVPLDGLRLNGCRMYFQSFPVRAVPWSFLSPRFDRIHMKTCAGLAERGPAGGVGCSSLRAVAVAGGNREDIAHTRAGRNPRSSRHAVRFAFQRAPQEPQGERDVISFFALPLPPSSFSRRRSVLRFTSCLSRWIVESQCGDSHKSPLLHRLSCTDFSQV